MKKKFNIWDVIAWIVLAGILLWLILKVFGIINTPDLIEYAPYFGIVYLAGWAMHKLETVVIEVETLKRFKDETVKQINDIKTNCIKNH
ncbi:MAG: hypothetical protein WC533_03135 [Candidatus Pacearchaeota archaeon]